MKCDQCGNEHIRGASFCKYCGCLVPDNIIMNKFDSILIGRGNDCAYRIRDVNVSRHHAKLIMQSNGDLLLQDLESTNGTFLKKNGRRISEISVNKDTVVYFASQKVSIADIISSIDVEFVEKKKQKGNIIQIGRDTSNTIVIDDQSVSQFHAEIYEMTDGTWELKDYGSTNGTFVNRKKINVANISAHDSIQFGKYTVSAERLLHNRCDKYGNPAFGKTSLLPQSLFFYGLIVSILFALWYFYIHGNPTISFNYVESLLVEDDKKMIEFVEQATVMIFTKNSHGTGFFISKNTIVTNHHVVKNDEYVFIINKKLGKPYVAKVVSFEREGFKKDYAALTTEENLDITPLKLNTTINIGNNVSALGYPGVILEHEDMNEKTVPAVVYTTGVINTIHRDDFVKIIHSADVRKGNSGGPLFNAQGHAVGINTYIVNPNDINDAKGSINFSLGSIGIIKFLKKNNIPFDLVEE